MKELFELKRSHRQKRKEIERRLSEFRKLNTAGEKKIFEELCFCLLTPGANAENCKKIIRRLKANELLWKGRRRQLWPYLKYARFYDQKACRLVAAREFFSSNRRLEIKKKVFRDEPFLVRDWLVKHVGGLGLKEASHFLRNIGLGEKLAILDRHILKRLKEVGVITELPKTLTPKRYLQIEAKMRAFSQRIGIPLAHLDLLFFSRATGRSVRHCK